jgi:hypothetical protein
LQVNVLQDVLNDEMPENVVCLGQNLAKFIWPQSAIPEKLVPIRPCEIFHPQRFYFQFVGEKYNRRLENCMRNFMQDFYQQQGDSLKCKKLYEGLYVVCLYDANFHRAVITEVFSEKSCKIFYIDYGTVEKKMLYELYYLDCKFMDVAPQACIGILYNIKPKGGGNKWSIDAITEVYQLLQNSRSHARIKAIDKQRKLVVMDLINLRDKKVINVSNELVRLGFAEHTDSSKSCPIGPLLVNQQSAHREKQAVTIHKPQENHLDSNAPLPQLHNGKYD